MITTATRKRRTARGQCTRCGHGVPSILWDDPSGRDQLCTTCVLAALRADADLLDHDD